jgi:hypothetical protein
MNPIRVFYSTLTRRFYASRHYREEGGGLVTTTGEKFDVTDDIARLVVKYSITFTERKDDR